MTFRLFGFDVHIQPMFWLMAVLFGAQFLWTPGVPKPAIVVWVLVVFLSVLVHELGHAIAISRHGISPEISLHGMGGTTSWRMVVPISRPSRIIISLAGPFAGFALAGIVYAVLRSFGGDVVFDTSLENPGPRVLFGSAMASWPYLALFALKWLLNVNVLWGIINLLPVLPLDGGHVLESAMGPKRERLTAAVSFGAAALLVIFFVTAKWYIAAIIFAMSGLQSLSKLRQMQPEPVAARPVRRTQEDGITSQEAAALRRGRNALADDSTAQAVEIAEQVLAGSADPTEVRPPSLAATRSALEIISWSHLMSGRLDQAETVHAAVGKLGEADAALTAAILIERGKPSDALKVLDAARGKGDDRKEIVGPLIRVLLDVGDVVRGAAVALEFSDNLSTSDVRQIAKVAFDARAFDAAARLHEAMFDRDHEPEDAYEAARAHALAGAPERALEALKKAVSAGFSDRARAWSDAALAVLRERDGLDSVLPRP